jgi:hypothetical protein
MKEIGACNTLKSDSARILKGVARLSRYFQKLIGKTGLLEVTISKAREKGMILVYGSRSC